MMERWKEDACSEMGDIDERSLETEEQGPANHDA
jgi:hypothetical protein